MHLIGQKAPTARAPDTGVDGEVNVVGGQNGRHHHPLRPPRFVKDPVGFQAGTGHADRPVILQIGRIFRLTVASQIVGTGTDDSARRAERDGNQRRLGQHADANGQIDPFIDQIDDSIKQYQINANLGIRRQKIGHHRPHVQAPEHHRRGDDQSPGRLHLPRQQGRFGFFDIDQQMPATFEIIPPFISQRHAPRRSVEQTNAQRPLQRRQAAHD